MTPEYFFNHIKTPSTWKYKGLNHTRNDNDEIIIFGKVYDDGKSKIIRMCFSIASERCFIVERTQSTNRTGCNYKTVCDIRSQEIDRINDFIIKTYILQ